MISAFIGEGAEQCGIKVNYVNNYVILFYLNKALTHVRLQSIKPRKKMSTTPSNVFST